MVFYMIAYSLSLHQAPWSHFTFSVIIMCLGLKCPLLVVTTIALGLTKAPLQMADN